MSPELLSATIAGGAIAIAAMFFKHRFDMPKLALEAKQYPFHVVYDKQTQFFDALAPIVWEVSSYILHIRDTLSDTSVDAPPKVQQAMENNSSISQFGELLGRYYMYFPGEIWKKGKDLLRQCLSLSDSADTNKTNECINRFSAFTNAVRKYVGADALPKDLFQALVPRVQKDKSTQPGDDNPKS